LCIQHKKSNILAGKAFYLTYMPDIVALSNGGDISDNWGMYINFPHIFNMIIKFHARVA